MCYGSCRRLDGLHRVQNMKSSGENQVCVISGESGAGKTETAKLFVKQLIHVSAGSEIDGLHNKLVQVNPVLEAFGNAQTLMNDNSSRFGKFTEVVFTPEGKRLASWPSFTLHRALCVVVRVALPDTQQNTRGPGVCHPAGPRCSHLSVAHFRPQA